MKVAAEHSMEEEADMGEMEVEVVVLLATYSPAEVKGVMEVLHSKA